MADYRNLEVWQKAMELTMMIYDAADTFPNHERYGLVSQMERAAVSIPSREALIKSLFAFILEFLCNARNGLTRIASYLRKPMTKQCIKILIKENSMN